MAKQTINIGSTANDGTGSTLRVGGDIINDNFNEIYTAFGDGSTLTAPLTAAGTSTLTNKTIDLDANTVTGTLAEFNTALQGDSFVSLTGSETLTNKTLTTPTIAEIDATGDFTIDAVGDIKLDAGGGDVEINDDGTVIGKLSNSSSNFQLTSIVQDKDFVIKGNDGGSFITALTLDMSEAGAATFGGAVTVTGNLTVNGTTTTVNSTNTTLDDNLLELNSGATSNANDTGIIMERGSTGDNAIIAWDESEDKFIVGTTTATASDTGNLSITTGTLVGNIEGNLTGNVTGNVSGSSGSTTGNAATATALATGRTIAMTGDVVWTSASFDGSGNVTGVAALQANTVSSTELVSAVTLEILDSGGSTVKTIIGAGS
nr:phage baseplate protein [uncultured Mediterranean phage uvMED]BAR29669.1 phage baseplate protein [uncultured Mediterranean phage uvMED]